jgi:hypothetical protein
MSSENPEIRHPSIPDSGDAEHRNMPGLILFLLLGLNHRGEEKVRRKSIDEVGLLVTKITSTKMES